MQEVEGPANWVAQASANWVAQASLNDVGPATCVFPNEAPRPH